jgi:hypothetical protein
MRWNRVLLTTGVAVVVALCAYASVCAAVAELRFGSDFIGTIWRPDHAVLHGLPPYPDASRPLPSAPAVYPPTIFVLSAPLGLLPAHIAAWVWFGILVAAAFGIAWAVSVRVPWFFALLLISLPVAQALMLGNASILIALGVALTWRFRDRPGLGPLMAAVTVSIKPWAWPLLVWLLLVRPRAGVRAAISFVGLTLVSWASLGFSGLSQYPALMHDELLAYARAGDLFVGVLTHLDVPVAAAAGLGLAGGLALLGAAAARRSNDLQAFSFALLAALVATPVAWPHYLVLMAIPIAIRWPRPALAWLWFPGVFVLVEIAESGGRLLESFAFCLLAVIPVVAVNWAPLGGRRVGRLPEPQPT